MRARGFTWIALAVAVAGCAGGAGAQGSQGLQGPAGPPGANGGLVWKDATGKDLGPYLVMAELGTGILSPISSYFDGEGNIWSLDPLSATLDGAGSISSWAYDGADCSGNGFIVAYRTLPRWVMTASYGDAHTYWVLADDATPVTPNLVSYRYSSDSTGYCTNGAPYSSSYVFYPVSRVRQVFPPALEATAPLHVERVLP